MKRAPIDRTDIEAAGRRLVRVAETFEALAASMERQAQSNPTTTSTGPLPRGRQSERGVERHADDLEPIAYRMEDAVRVSGIGRTKLYSLVKSGELRVTKVGKRTLVPRSELVRLIEVGVE